MPRRSRGCQECRKRRIGCDGAQPSCRQCLTTGRACSGPMQGPIFIDQTGGVTVRYAQSSMHSQIRPGHRIRQPSLTAISYQALNSKFISSITSQTASPSTRAWICYLEDIPYEKRGPALDISFRAVALAFCGVESGNHAAVVESCRLYGEAMSKHARLLSQRSKDLDPAMLYTSVILAFFETIWSSSATAYAIHLTAAWKMLNSVDWETNNNEVLRQVAMHVQNETLFMLLAAPLGDIRAGLESGAWSSALISQVEESQQLADQLTTQLFKLWKLICAKDLDADVDTTALHLCSIGSRIEDIWIAYRESAILRGEAFPHRSGDEMTYRDGAAALMEAYFAAAQVMLSLAGPMAPSHAYLASVDPCHSILTAASYLFQGRTSIGCVGHDIFLPLALVALHSTSSKYRKMAYTFLEDPILGVPFEGLRTIVVQRITSAGAEAGSHLERAPELPVAHCRP